MMNLRTLQEQRDDSVQWDLGGCCEVEESLYLGLYFAYAIVFWCLSSTSCFKPMRLLSVFIHEISHALGRFVCVCYIVPAILLLLLPLRLYILRRVLWLQGYCQLTFLSSSSFCFVFILSLFRSLVIFVEIACILTGGKVHKVRVEDNEGGVTQHQGGIRLCVIPAGYVGAAFWGGAIVALSGGARLGSTIAAGAIVFSLLLAMWYVLGCLARLSYDRSCLTSSFFFPHCFPFIYGTKVSLRIGLSYVLWLVLPCCLELHCILSGSSLNHFWDTSPYFLESSLDTTVFRISMMVRYPFLL